MNDPNATAFVPTAAGHPMLANLDPVRLAPPIFVNQIGESNLARSSSQWTLSWRKQDSNPRSLGYCAAGASRNSRLPASVEMVEPLRCAAVESELLGL